MNKAEYSKRAIIEALLQLLKTENYHDLTIQRIVDEAQVSRMAFYRNFGTKDAIMKLHLDRVTDDFMARTHMRFVEHEPYDYFQKLLGHLMEHREMGLALIRADLFDLMRAEFDRAFAIMNPPLDSVGRYRFHFIAGGMCNVYYQWLTGGCRESCEELTEIMVRALSAQKQS